MPAALALRIAALLLLAPCLASAAPPAEADCPPPLSAPSAAAREGWPARDRGFLWRIERDGRASWLFGTIHVGRPDWVRLWPKAQAALAASDRVALELDLLDPAMQRRLARAVGAAPARPIAPALRNRLDRLAAAECLSATAIAPLAPELQLSTIVVAAARRDGLDTAFGLDLALSAQARAARRPVESLETPQQQLRALLAVTPAEQRTVLAAGIADLETGRARPLLLRIARIWAHSDLDDLARHDAWCECRRTPAEAAATARMIEGRNPAMAARIAALHAGGQRVFAAVGSLHLVGPQGLPALLARKGFRVQRITWEATTMDEIRELWNFGDPAASEQVFRAKLASAQGDWALSLRTQIARTLGLRKRFDEADAELDAIEPLLAGAGVEPRVRYLLERGRTFRSGKQPEKARPLFEQAVALAGPAGLESLAIDAMHMVALVEPTPEAQLDWNRRAMALAREADDPSARRWVGSLAHNIGMSLHEAGRYEEALASFREMRAFRERQGDAADERIARWMIAWTLRAMKRHDEAIAMQQALAAEFERLGTPDGFVFEELGENLLAQGDAAAAKPWFARAHAVLSAMDGLDRPDDAKLERLLQLSR